MLKPICERLTYAQLYGYTDQGRRDRARSVRGPALEIESMPSNQAYHFNFRAYPSTEGKRHQGYVKFFKPKDPKTPLHKLECEVDCTCFASDTLVLMGDGTQKPISQIVQGDTVYTHNGRVRRVLGNVERELKPGERVYKLHTAANRATTVTGNHRYIVDVCGEETRVRVDELRQGDVLRYIAANGSVSFDTVVVVVASDYDGTVWDLCVDDDHTFVAHGHAVANCKDYRYRWAFSNKQRGSGRVGPSSLNKAWNKAPRITNPSNKVSLCKHLGRVRDYIVNMLYGGKTADQLGRLVTLTRTPVVLGGKRVPQSQQPSTKLPQKKPAPAPAPAKPTPLARIRVGRTESVVSCVNHNQDRKAWARLFEDDTAPGGIVTNDSEKLDKLLSVVKELVSKIDALSADEAAPSGEDGGTLPDGAVELDLGTGEPKPGEPELEIVGGDGKEDKCPPCDVKDMVPEAPNVADLEDEDEVEVDAPQPEGDLDADELEKSGKAKPAPKGDPSDEELDGEDDEDDEEGED